MKSLPTRCILRESKPEGVNTTCGALAAEPVPISLLPGLRITLLMCGAHKRILQNRATSFSNTVLLLTRLCWRLSYEVTSLKEENSLLQQSKIALEEVLASKSRVCSERDPETGYACGKRSGHQGPHKAWKRGMVSGFRHTWLLGAAQSG